MASAAGKWREEQILVVCPGSRTTMAQLGCVELTPPMHRIPTRMFKDGDEWRPYHTYLRKRIVGGVEQEDWVEDVDSEEGALYPIQGGRIVEMDAFLAFLDHVHAMLTTTYHNTPIILMASPQWTRPDCETIARYIFEKTRTPALCMIHSGLATQYGLKWPNMTVIDIGYEKVDVTAIHDGRVVNHLDLGAPTPDRHISGGEVFTQRLLKLLKKKDFSYDMAEKLKKSAICEVLPYAAGVDGVADLPVYTGPAVAAAPPPPVISAPAAEAGPAAPEGTDPSKLPEDGAEEEENGELNGDDDGVLDVAKIVTSGQTKEFLAKKEKEKGKPGRKSNKEKEAEAAAAARPVRLPNSKRARNTFWYEEVVQEEVPREPKETVTNGAAAAVTTAMATTTVTDVVAPKADEAATGDAPKPMDEAKSAEDVKPVEDAKPVELNGEAAAAAEAKAAEDRAAEAKAAEEKAAEAKAAEERAAEARAAEAKAAEERAAEARALEEASANDTPEHRAKRVRRDIEVGLERFTFADRGEIDRIVSTIYRAIQGIDDMYMRPACWDNLVFVGNGARLRGLKDNILQTLNARHLISPSTATMFTSELPSNMATPTGTGSQTPTGSFTGAPHQLSSSGVNPLLQAATTASTLGLAAAAATPQAGSEAGGPVASHHFHSQTPTSIKTSNLPTYLSEWTKNGFEEAMFLGAQVAGRIAFCLHSNMDAQSIEAQRLMSLNRVDYNELGPKGVRTHSMLS